MFIWLILGVIVLSISIVLAFRSMADYREIPGLTSQNYSLFLIKNSKNLTAQLMQEIHQKVLADSLMLSFERLRKGEKTALVIYGPATILSHYKEVLQLVELEDYSQKAATLGQEYLTWEMGSKVTLTPDVKIDRLPIFPQLVGEEQFWWQVVLKPVGGGGTKQPQGKLLFDGVVRTIVFSSNKERVKNLKEELSKIYREQNLVLLPQAYSTKQLLKFYQGRAFGEGGVPFSKKNHSLKLTDLDLLTLLES